MITQLKLLDYQSEQGDKSRREDGLGDPHGATITPTSAPKPPQDIQKNAKISVPRTKTGNHTPEGRRTQNKVSNELSRSRWTDDQWRKEYWRNTNEHPRDLVKRAIEREDGKTAIIIDHILNGYHRDNRKHAKRTVDDFDPEGSWYLMVQLLHVIKGTGVHNEISS